MEKINGLCLLTKLDFKNCFKLFETSPGTIVCKNTASSITRITSAILISGCKTNLFSEGICSLTIFTYF